MAKKTVTIDFAAITANRAVRVAAVVAILIALTIGSHSIGYGSGHKEGYAEGDLHGWTTGARAGVEKAYWVGREDGCLWVFDAADAPYVVGETNPHATFYFLLGLGDTYLERSNCDTTGHEAAPDIQIPYQSTIDSSVN